MTISYPLDLPTDPSPRKISLRYSTAVAVGQNPYTLKVFTFVHDGQIWLADVELPILTWDQANTWGMFLASLNGAEGTFYLYDTSAPQPRGAATGTPLVNGAGQTGQILLTKGWTPSTVNIMKKGDPLQIGTSYYKVLNDVNSDGSGNATLDIFPKLRENYSDNAPIIVSTPKGIFRLADNDINIKTVGPDKLSSISFSAIEAI